MHDGVGQFISDCAESRVGRLVFVAYLIYVVSMIGYAYGHFPYLTYPYRFYGERELFEIMNAPQLELIRSSRFLFRWQASKLTDAIAAVYIALPWWVYGYVGQLIVRRIADNAPHEVSGDSALTCRRVRASLAPSHTTPELSTQHPESRSRRRDAKARA